MHMSNKIYRVEILKWYIHEIEVLYTYRHLRYLFKSYTLKYRSIAKDKISFWCWTNSGQIFLDVWQTGTYFFRCWTNSGHISLGVGQTGTGFCRCWTNSGQILLGAGRTETDFLRSWTNRDRPYQVLDKQKADPFKGWTNSGRICFGVEQTCSNKIYIL